jgi:hypothetical protein
MVQAAQEQRHRRYASKLLGDDNHWFDDIVGCAVATTLEGAVLRGTQARADHAVGPEAFAPVTIPRPGNHPGRKCLSCNMATRNDTY